ncbi:hypothetical protein QO034_14520 [Sedimentitalea sp. JM2-8]|uniref:DUF2946 domain-containing protein n=1 Tax=Sedimentitalea xiamensis TaxID=3050037 RepID=A0ABT7FGS9_9RHOB|nr:hypothetical protein [Sedimentitalea xiamensis]MDK3074318.1 hypothetical protein [Sedimentitalea xiamensis]
MRKPVSITRLLQIALLAVALCALVFSTTSAVHAAMGHHGGNLAVEPADGHAVMEHAKTKPADCTSSKQNDVSTDDGLNCCSAMCSAAYLVEAVATATSDRQDAHFGLPLQTLTSREAHGLLRPPSI